MQIQVSPGCAIDSRVGRFPPYGTIDSQRIARHREGDQETRIGEMAAVITTRSVQDMGLKVGDRVAALVKATNVSLRRRGF